MLYNSILMPISEIIDLFTSRPVLIKYKHFAFLYPTIFYIAQIIIDIPIIIFQLSYFIIVLYFMVGLKASLSVFFTHCIVFSFQRYV